ncbi:MAG: pyrophosphokinae [Blastocatellia bacterium]|jgi:tetratricopeptide (TPR) repeat protein|nr:pyrophosphokinae [Blastocatellia bacterium]
MSGDEEKKESDWSSWLDRHRYKVGLAVFIAFFLLYGLLIYMSGKRALTPLEQASMGLIGIVVSAAFGVVLGIPLAKRRVKIASQLRRAYGISQTLRNVQRDVDDATGRMERRANITDPAILREFWQEIAANIRTGLREPIFEAERMVEDWGEMDPDERFRIQTEERRKTEEIQELTRQIQTAKSVEKDLEGVGSQVSARLAASVEVLEKRVRELQEARPSRDTGPAAGSAKAALDLGQYQEAVKIYDDIIRGYPGVHSNYVGRAKARYLAGDSVGALADLKTARGIFADDPLIDKLEEQITGGEAVTASVPSTAFIETIAGHQALSSADAQSAAQHYQRAAELGWNPFFVKFNLAMAKSLQGDIAASETIMRDLTAEDGSYMAINKRALLSICAICAGQSPEDVVDALRRYVEGRDFEFNKSPLKHLEAGFQAVRNSCSDQVAPLFTMLRSHADVSPA